MKRFSRVLCSLAFLAFCAACSSSTTGPKLCWQDGDCPSGQVCRNGACRGQCLTSQDCPDGQQCISGACLLPCQVDRDCPPGEECENGYCRAVEPLDGGQDGRDGWDGQDGFDGGSQDCQPGTVEACGTATGTCEPGARTCLPEGRWSDCEGGKGPEDETCDGLDNDCDGTPDNNLEPPPGTCLSEGVCAETVVQCQGGRWLCRYPAGYQPGEETLCDGLDNDCDGRTDEELVPPPNFCPQEGICAAGVEATCSAGAWRCNFPAGYEQVETSCDALDNDCDGFTDEGLTHPPAGTCLESGVCASFRASCHQGQWQCTYPTGYEVEERTCDGLDNDCDGRTDEELVADLCSHLGVCRGTMAACENGRWVCHYPPEYQVPDSTCDGVDNDCDGVPDSGLLCNGICCELGQICRYDTCLPDLGNCQSNEDCQEDSWCDNGQCIPYGQGPQGDTNPECTRLVVAGLFQPALQCEWTGPPAADPYPNHVQVLGTPVVADFDFDGDPTVVRPSLVFNTYDALDGDSGVQTTLDGVIRIIDGATCETQFSLGPYLNGCNPVAIGDLDLDGRPEIVAHRNTAGVIAYKYLPASSSWVELWRGHNSSGSEVTFSEGATGWGGPSLVDLDDDGLPEVLSGGLVYDATGLLIDSHLGLSALFRVGFPVAADLDLDGRVELAGGNYIWEFDPGTRAWVVQASGPVSGYTAVADFGTYGANAAQDDRSVLDGVAEVVIVASGSTRIINVLGRTVFGPVNIPSSTGGGPPTIGDFDGDGRTEYAASGSDSMNVFDPDCHANPDPAFCPTSRTDGILWSKPSQDHSSNITGSSLFDFEGDGVVEAVYADECFTRVYRGSDGKVLYSQWRSSCTWNENPIVADVDGDYSAELVVPANQSCGTAPQNMGGLPYETSPNGRPMDPLFAGLPCQDGADCLSGLCDAGYCRCTQHAECGGAADGFVCAPPPAGTPGAGNTCRAEWRSSINGVKVYRDVLDRWVGSRTIWNQHAYSVTNVEENGGVPRTSQAQRNWQVVGLNNFRQNVQGDLRPDTSPDLTAGGGAFALACDGQGNLELSVRVCNRGTYPIAAGVEVGFYDGDPTQGGPLICQAVTGVALPPGRCSTVACLWAGAPVSEPHDVAVVVDPDSERTECIEGNNLAWIRGAACPYP